MGGPGGSELERDFTYIDDIVTGCLGALDNIGPSGHPAQYKIYNLGNNVPVSVSKFLSVLEELMGTQAQREYVQMPKAGDVLRTHANISLAQAELGYMPTTSLEKGLGHFVDWYKEYFKDGLDQEMSNYHPL